MRVPRLALCARQALYGGWVALLVNVGNSAAAATNYPTDINLAVFNRLVVLEDYDDVLHNVNVANQHDGIFSAINYVQILPDALVPTLRQDAAKYDFTYLPILNEDNSVKELIVDFSLETRPSKSAQSYLATHFPNATQFYPVASSGKFPLIQSTEGITVEQMVTDDLLLTVTSPEPIRLRISPKGLKNVACAIDALNYLKRKAESAPAVKALDLNNLSLLTGGLELTYKVADFDILTRTWAYTNLRHSLKPSLTNENGPAGQSLGSEIEAVIKMNVSERCDQTKVRHKDWAQLQSIANQSNLNLKQMYDN